MYIEKSNATTIPIAAGRIIRNHGHWGKSSLMEFTESDFDKSQ